MRFALPRRYGAALIGISLIAYFAIGLHEGMLGVAWPSMSEDFHVTIPSFGVLLAILTVGYGTASAFSGRLIGRFGAGTVLTASAAAATIGVLGYTVAPNWISMLACAVFTGCGIGSMDGAINSYAALRFSSVVTNWIHGFFAVGASVGPAMMTAILVAGSSWNIGYLIAAGVFASAMLYFLFSRSRWNLDDDADVQIPKLRQVATRMSDTLRLRQAWFGIALFALYAGVEVAVGQWTFTVLTQSREISTAVAGSWVTAYYVGLTLGRIGVGSLTGFFQPNRVMRASIAAAVVAAVLFWADIAPWLGFVAIFTLGLCLGPVFPSLISTTPARIGRAHTSNLVGFQMTGAAAGVAIIPGGFGLIARFTGVAAIPGGIAVLTVALLVLFVVVERSGRPKPSDGNPVR
jgi:fucose permease